MIELPPGFVFIGDPARDAVKTPLYYRPDPNGMPKFSGYWWHDERIEVAVKRGYAAWIDPGTYANKDAH